MLYNNLVELSEIYHCSIILFYAWITIIEAIESSYYYINSILFPSMQVGYVEQQMLTTYSKHSFVNPSDPEYGAQWSLVCLVAQQLNLMNDINHN